MNATVYNFPSNLLTAKPNTSNNVYTPQFFTAPQQEIPAAKPVDAMPMPVFTSCRVRENAGQNTTGTSETEDDEAAEGDEGDDHPHPHPEHADHEDPHPEPHPEPDQPRDTEPQANDDMIDRLLDDFFANAPVPEVVPEQPKLIERTSIDHTNSESTETPQTDEEPVVQPPPPMRVQLPEQTVRRREQKQKVQCPGCALKFWHLDDEFNICHNCVKIVHAIETQCQRHHGRFQIVTTQNGQQARLHVVVRCNFGHQWVTEFVAKQGRKWCAQCRTDDRQTRRQERINEEQQEQARLAAAQEQSFQRAMQQHVPAAAEEVKEPVHMARLRQIVQWVVQQTDHQQNQQQIMNDLVEAVIAATDDQVAGVFAEEVGADQMARVDRRMKFMLHPDRNGHNLAKEAFQRLSNSKWKLKYTKLLRSRGSFIICTEIFQITAQTAMAA